VNITKPVSFVFCSLVIGWFCYAETKSTNTNVDEKKKLSKEELRIRMLTRTGGIITVPGTGNITIINKQSNIPDSTVQLFADHLGSMLRSRVLVTKDCEFSICDADNIRRNIKANIAFFLIADRKLPISLVSMEGRWAMINIAHISEGTTEAEILKKRTLREFQRTLKALLTSVVIDGDMAQIITKGNDLDDVKGGIITPQVIVEMLTGLPAWGITPDRTSTYKKACKQGWAPAPTNEYQKAIWDRVHAAPKNPMKIEFDPKKGR